MLRATRHGPVAKFFRPIGEPRESAAEHNFWLQGWVLRRSTPYLWLRRNRVGRAQFPHKPRAEKLCDRPLLSPSRSSTASWAPVEAPDGTAARPKEPSSRSTSTSTVGLPRLSRISRA